MSNQGQMSLADLEGFRSDTLAWDVAVPDYVPAEQISVNVPLLGRIARLGGIGHLRVGSYDGDRTKTEAEVSSLAPDGSSTASMKAVSTKAQLVDSDVSNGSQRSRFPYSEYWWADAQIRVNSSELGDKMMETARNGGSVRDPKPWARFLDKSLRQGISHSTREQLLGNVSGFSIMILGATALGVSLAALSASPEFAAINGLEASLIQQAVNSTASAMFYGAHIKERRLSLIPGYQIDRLAIAQALIKTRKLVKAKR